MKKKKIISTLVLLVFLVAVALAGYLTGRNDFLRRLSESPVTGSPVLAAPQVWTCSMHPQIRLSGPGRCPICEMPLIPSDSSAQDSGEIPSLQLSAQALAMARVETTPVERRELTHALRAVGKISYNESSLATVTARVNGYAERLFVDLTGIEIKAGDHLLEIYSPELITAQQEMLIALGTANQRLGSSLVESSRHKLRRWGLTEEQIDSLATKKQIAERVTIYSPITGTVLAKMVVKNSSFREGDVLYRVANLDVVWAYVDVYEYDLPWIRYGQTVKLTAEALPGQEYAGRVSFVLPVVNELTRTIQVPVYIVNPDHALKPGMFVSVTIQSLLQADGQAAPTGVEGQFTCPMHPQVLNRSEGECPHCGMSLVLIPGAAKAPAEPTAARDKPKYACPMGCEGDKTYSEQGNCPVCEMKLTAVKSQSSLSSGGLLVIPASAVLDCGSRQLVYVEKKHGLFESREVVLGPRAEGFYPILRGLTEGERVVTRGGFLIDSQFQISGRPSLLYPGGLTGDLPTGPKPGANSGMGGVSDHPAAEPAHHEHN